MDFTVVKDGRKDKTFCPSTMSGETTTKIYRVFFAPVR
jgi:hypothetical protein